MLYLTPTKKKDDLPVNIFGYLLAPQQWALAVDVEPDRYFGVDSGAFTGKFEEKAFFKYLDRLVPYKDRCLFVACPDVVSDPKTTLELYSKYRDQIKNLGLPVAFCAQDGILISQLPNDYDCLFIGGSTAWKMGEEVPPLIRHAKSSNKTVHVGRVNSFGRWNHFAKIGIDSVDGNHVRYKPTERIKQIITWHQKLSELNFSGPKIG